MERSGERVRERVRATSGRWRISLGLVVFGTWSAGRQPLRELDVQAAVKTAPKSETPIEPPTWRNSVEPLVATPITPIGTEFWTASTSTCMTMPEAEADDRRVEHRTSTLGVFTSSCVSSNIADRHHRGAGDGKTPCSGRSARSAGR